MELFSIRIQRTFQLVSTLQRAMRIILSLHPVLQQNGADVFSLQKERGPLLGLFMMKYFKLDLYDIL